MIADTCCLEAWPRSTVVRRRIALTLLGGLLAVPGCTVDVSRPEPSVSTAHPPATGKPVMLDTRVPDWETSAWLSRTAFCVRAARVEPQEGKPNEVIYCGPAPEALQKVGPPLLPSKPLPYLQPTDPRSQKIILVGTVRGAVATVSVAMFGQTATARVHRLPATGGRHIGAYAVWLPRSGPERDGMSLEDIAAVVGHDASGAAVTRLE